VVPVSFYESADTRDRRRSNRYRTCKLLTDTDTGEKILSSRDVVAIPPNVEDTLHTLRSHEVGRLDILAQLYYNNSLLWWVIAQANDIRDPFMTIPVGTVLRIPALSSLYSEGGVLA
jgi:hypothetical protein